MQVFLFLALLIAVIAVVFAVQNTLIVTVSFFFWKFTGSLALVLLLAIVAGALISFLVSLPAIVRGRWSLRNLRKDYKQRLTEMENSLAEHKKRLEEAQGKLQAPSTPAGQPPQTGGKPSD